MNRRRLLRTVAYAPLLLVGCAPGSGSSLLPAQVINYAAATVGALQKLIIAPQIAALIPPQTQVDLLNLLLQAQFSLQGIAAGMPAQSAATLLQTVVDAVGTVLNVLSAPPLNVLIPPPFSVIITAAAVALPIIETFVQSQIPPAPMPVPVPAPAATRLRALRARGVTMTDDQALAILRAAAK